MWVWSLHKKSGNLFQDSCLGNPMDRETWMSTVHGGTELDMTEHLYTQCHYKGMMGTWECAARLINIRGSWWELICGQQALWFSARAGWDDRKYPASWLLLLTCSVTSAGLTLFNLMDCSPPGSSVHGNLQARILGWVAMPFSRGSSRPRDWTCISCVSCIAGIFFTHWATWEALAAAAHLLEPSMTACHTQLFQVPNSGCSDASSTYSMSRTPWSPGCWYLCLGVRPSSAGSPQSGEDRSGLWTMNGALASLA